MIDASDVKADAIGILLAHCRSADIEILNAMRGLTPEQLDRQFEMGLGSIRATYEHDLGALRGWADVYANRPRRAWLPDEGPYTMDQLGALTTELHDDWAEIAGKFPLDEVIERPRGDSVRRFTRAHILVHVTTHSMHHRAQMINMLRHVGVADLPTGSVMHWVDAAVFP
ncbi:MAG: DinB family protein [Phycisphaerales bacterium]